VKTFNLFSSKRRFSAVNDRQTKKLEMITRVDALGDALTNDFAASSVGKQLFENLKTAIAEVEGHAAAEASGRTSARHGTGTRSEARENLRADLDAISRTARIMADDVPGVLNKFPAPLRNNDQALINTARAYLADATPFKAQFIAHELPADFLEDLAADIEAMVAAIADQSSGIGDHVAAGAALDDALDRAVEIVRKLEVIMKNKYAHRPDVLAEWTSASHTERAPRRSAGPGGTPPAGSPSPPSP
jgi:hypothetical protein